MNPGDNIKEDENRQLYFDFDDEDKEGEEDDTKRKSPTRVR